VVIKEARLMVETIKADPAEVLAVQVEPGMVCLFCYLTVGHPVASCFSKFHYLPVGNPVSLSHTNTTACQQVCNSRLQVLIASRCSSI
jgi:hypothetical protein